MSTLTPKIRAAYHSFQQYRNRQHAVRTLASLDDGILKDIGISRSQIPWAVDTMSRGREDKGF